MKNGYTVSQKRNDPLKKELFLWPIYKLKNIFVASAYILRLR